MWKYLVPLAAAGLAMGFIVLSTNLDPLYPHYWNKRIPRPYHDQVKGISKPAPY